MGRTSGEMLSPFSSPLLLAFLLLPTHLLARPNGGDQQFLTSVNKEGANKEGVHKNAVHKEFAHKEGAHKEGAHRGGFKSAAEEPTEDYEVADGVDADFFDSIIDIAVNACNLAVDVIRPWIPGSNESEVAAADS